MAVVVEEKIDNLRAFYLLENYTFEMFFGNWDGTKTDAKKEYSKIMKYLNEKVSTDNNYVKYNYVKKRTSGRLIGDNTIQSCIKNIRGFLCENLTTDIDMNNCHPTILFQLCEKHNIECPNLTMYINERKKCLNNIQADDNVKYEDAKKKVLVSTNMDKHIKTKCEFLKNYDKEMKYLQRRFLDIQEFSVVKEYAKTDNFNGSFINHILCINENDILTSMRTFCDINKVNIHSLMFDGLMVYGKINDYFIEEMEKHIHKNTMFDKMKLSIKEHQHDFIIPDNFKPKKRITYKDVKEEFQKYNCKVAAEFVSNKYNDVFIYKIGDFTVLHDELTYTNEEGVISPFMPRWFKDEDKRRFDKYDCIPKDSLCPSYVYNMWEKFPVELMPSIDPNDKVKKALDWFLNHIKVLANYNEEHYEFICTWLSQMFQYPENKTIHLIFVGEEGTGKGTFIKFLQTMMGGGNRCWECTDPQEDIFGKFNDMMKKAFLVVMNEADKSGTFNNNNKLKALITDCTINIRPKGKMAFNMKSCHRFMSFSNNPDPTVKNKRRDFTMRMSDDKKNDVKYFTEGNDYAKSIDCCKYIYDYFMAYKCKPNITEVDIPKGEYDTQLIEVQNDPVMEFLKELTYLHIEHIKPKDFPSNTLYELYLDYCKRNHIIYNSNKVSFCTKLAYKKISGLTKTVKKVNKVAVNVYTIDFQELQVYLNIDADVEEINVSDNESE